MKRPAKEVAKEFVEKTKKYGWNYEVRGGSVLTITKNIIPGNNDSFIHADSEYYDLLSTVPTTSPGSMWGTDGGGLGAVSAINSGRFKMNKSGCSKRVLNAIKKIK